jgi:flavorubredoxin
MGEGNMKITEDIQYVGVNDHELDLFEGQYIVPNGMAYNSYVIADDKLAVMDSVEAPFSETWLKNIESAAEGRTPDYLIVQHMEPDHSSSIAAFMDHYKNAKIVASAKAFRMMVQFYGTDYPERQVVIKNGDVLDLGTHKLQFLAAPMVHWPEVMMTYDPADKVLFSADAFGKFGALDVDEEWACEARRYYFGIVGKFGQQVQNVLKKAAALDIEKICALHGPMLEAPLDEYLSLYDTWSSYRAESEGVFIAYTSVYGHTKEAVMMLAEKLKEAGVPRIEIADLARDDQAEAVEDAFRHDRLVLATTTYNNDIFPFMRTFIESLTERGYKNRKIGLIENGTWAPKAAKIMKELLEGCQGLTFAPTTVSIRSALQEESRAAIEALAREMAAPAE